MCPNCKETKRCQKRGELKEEADFNVAAWRIGHLCRRDCKTCSKKERGCWKCASCATARPKRCFSRHARRRCIVRGGKQTCDICLAERDLKRTARRSQERLVRTRAKRKQRILAEAWRLAGEMPGIPASSGSNCKKEANGYPRQTATAGT